MRLVTAIAFVLLSSFVVGQELKPPADLPPLTDGIFAEIGKKTGLNPYREPTGNEIADRKWWDECVAFLKAIPGRKVQWTLALESVNEERMEFRPVVLQFERGADAVVEYHVFLNAGAKKEEGRKWTCNIKGLFDVARLEPLRRGDRIMVQGEVAAFARALPGQPEKIDRHFTFTLTNVKLTLPAK